MVRNKKDSGIESRLHYEHGPSEKPYFKGLPVPHIPDEKEDFNSATPKDITDRMQYQRDKVNKLRAVGGKQFTREWKDFGERHGKE